MLLLGFFLLPMVFVTGIELTRHNYIVKINGSVLENVEPIANSSDELDLSGLGLENIDELAFQNATNLTKLNLANNLLRILPSDKLKSLVNLKSLSVANNLIWKLPEEFIGLEQLQTLNLSNNRISVLFGIGGYGRGRCDFIVKGSPIYAFKYTVPKYDLTPTAKPPVPVFTSMRNKCVSWGPKIEHYAPDETNENATLIDETIKCPKLLEPWRVAYKVANPLNNTLGVEGCIEYGTFRRLNILPENSEPSRDCEKIYNYYGDPVINLARMGIRDFAMGWYRAKIIPYYSIHLAMNEISSFSSDFFNDLPESIKHIDLSYNKIKSLEAQIIQNNFLMSLDLTGNQLHEIEPNSLARTNLTGLILTRNNLVDTKFVETLPSTLEELYLNDNNISLISANSFSKLNKLFYLDLSLNKITKLGRESLRGLKSLQGLIMPYNRLREIESEAFRDFGDLRELDLGSNEITELKKSVFRDLQELIHLNLTDNKVKRLTKKTFPHNLRALYLSDNNIESVEQGTFVGAPKYHLMINNNAISRVEKGTFDIPSLKFLWMNKNKLSEITEENFDLPSLYDLALNDNFIRKIEKGSFRKLRKLQILRISGNKITTLQNGSLFGIDLSSIVFINKANLELIQGGAYFDERLEL